ncbi:MAG TPA: CotH kinase family protein [Verrucomicrobiae bacterium]|nr:CotH kinase family protein [Verrucomicrobiae bacterium]
MKKKVSKLAVLSMILGGTGVFFALLRAVVLLVVAIPLGPAALLSGLLAIWVIRRRSATLRGTRLAIWGACLGIIGTLLSMVVLAGMFTGQFDPDQMRQQQEGRMQRTASRNAMPGEALTNFTSNLPIIVLQTEKDGRSRRNGTIARAQFFDIKGDAHRASIKEKPDHEGLISFHPRGNTSLHLPKHSYTLHTLDAETNQTKIGLFGLPKEEDWVLYASFEDKTMIRDVLAFQLANKMGRYAPRTRYVELFQQDASEPLSMRHYSGVYVLMEKIKRGKERVNIAQLKAEDASEPEITGGYILKRDHGEDGGKRFRTERGGPYFFVYPKPEEITAEQRAWITRYFKSFEAALYGPDFADVKTGYAAFLEVDAFIDAHWLVELSKNVDGFRYSSFLTKDRGGKIRPGPAWDWNRSFGNANYYGGWQTQGWYSSNLRPNEICWYDRLSEDPAFLKRCNARWRALRKNIFDPAKINATIDQLARELEEAQQRNFQRWPILGEQITSNHYVGQTYRDEVQWLKKWVERRIAWIDNEMGEGRAR